MSGMQRNGTFKRTEYRERSFDRALKVLHARAARVRCLAETRSPLCPCRAFGTSLRILVVSVWTLAAGIGPADPGADRPFANSHFCYASSDQVIELCVSCGGWQVPNQSSHVGSGIRDRPVGTSWDKSSVQRGSQYGHVAHGSVVPSTRGAVSRTHAHGAVSASNHKGA